jgi:hypothetical protein
MWQVLGCRRYVNEWPRLGLSIADLSLKGNWIAATSIPSQTLESREMRLQGEDRELLLALLRKILKWLPEERPSAEDLFEDGFILQFMSDDGSVAP